MPRLNHYSDSRIPDCPSAVIDLYKWEHFPAGKGAGAGNFSPQEGQAVLQVFASKKAYEAGEAPIPDSTAKIRFTAADCEAMDQAIAAGQVTSTNEAILAAASAIEFAQNGDINPAHGSEYIDAVRTIPEPEEINPEPNEEPAE